MHGLMMESELLISSILRHANKNFGDREIVSVTADNPLHRYTYADCCRRTASLPMLLINWALIVAIVLRHWPGMTTGILRPTTQWWGGLCLPHGESEIIP